MVTPLPLWPHQEAAVPDLLAGHHLLLWSMGTGKTAALIRAGQRAGGRQLWVTLGMLIAQTEREFHRFRPGASIQIVRTGKDNISTTADVVIVSYDLMRTIPVWRQLFKLRWASCVADEGHALAHGQAVRTRAFYGARQSSPGALYLRCDRVWIATGTPILNSPDELWTHLSRLAPHLLPEHVKTRQHFLDEFCVVQMKTFGPVVVGGRNLGQLSSILKCCSSRLRLEDVTTLPELTVATLPVEVTAADRRAMDAALTDAQLAEIKVILTEIEGGSEAAWQRLQAMMLPLASMRRVTALAKAPGCVEAIRAELDGGADRIVVFGSHIDALKYIHKYSRDTRLIIGETTQVQRDMALAAFEQGIARVLVCNTSVGGFGLNLQHSARCFMLDLPWTPAGLDQAIARLHRAGQRRHVHVSLLAVARSIDERVATILQRKRRLISEIVEGTTA